MENQDRDMGPDTKRKEEIARPSKNKERLTIMIFKEVGKVKTFTLSPRLLLWASLFLIFYIVVTLFLTNAYLTYFYPLKSRGIDEFQAERIAKLSKELIKTTKSLERSKQHIALLEDYIKEEKEQSPEPMSSGDYTESSSPKLVGIEELKVKRDRSTINVAFKIVNRQSDEEPIGGYIFILASIRDSDQSEVWVYPSSPLKDGLPANYKRGQRFLIQRFKSISGRYTLTKLTDKPLILEILVYDREGELVLKKVVEV
jgi:uncharacterized coiled-coil protein SlyX